MPGMKSDNSSDIQYHVLLNLTETHQVCHDVVLFHWTEHKKHPKKNNPCYKRTKDNIFFLREFFILAHIKLTIQTTTATKATLEWKLKLI